MGWVASVMRSGAGAGAVGVGRDLVRRRWGLPWPWLGRLGL
jgi:hypothetical protein